MRRILENFCLLCLSIFVSACPTVADGGLEVVGEVSQIPYNSTEHCTLNLYTASDGAMVSSSRIGRKFEAFFVISPYNDMYFISLTCDVTTGTYTSEVFATDQPLTIIDLGLVELSEKSQGPTIKAS